MVTSTLVLYAPALSKNIDLEPIFLAYEKICGFHEIPILNEIHHEYNYIYEAKVTSYKAAFYPDDFYDGSPYSKPRDILPDSVIGDLDEHVGMMSLEREDIQRILESFCLFYVDNKDVHHSPVLEVW